MPVIRRRHDGDLHIFSSEQISIVSINLGLVSRFTHNPVLSRSQIAFINIAQCDYLALAGCHSLAKYIVAPPA